MLFLLTLPILLVLCYKLLAEHSYFYLMPPLPWAMICANLVLSFAEQYSFYPLISFENIQQYYLHISYSYRLYPILTMGIVILVSYFIFYLFQQFWSISAMHIWWSICRGLYFDSIITSITIFRLCIHLIMLTSNAYASSLIWR